MAYTATLLKQDVEGSQRVVQFLVTADAASGSVATGLGFINCLAVGTNSCTTGAFKVKANLDATSAAANGTVFVSSITSGDAFYLTVWGR